MSTRLPANPIPGPAGREIAASVTALLRNPLKEYVALATRYGDTVRVPIGRHRDFYPLSRPGHAEHVPGAGREQAAQEISRQQFP